MDNEIKQDENEKEKKRFFPQIDPVPSEKKMNYKLKRLLIFWGAVLVVVLLVALIWWVISIV